MANLTLSKPTAKLPRNGFDLSRRFVNSIKVGECAPVFTCETVPGGHYEIKPIDLVRTLPLNTAAFARMKQRLDYYFVPYSQLYQKFDEFIAQREDPVSNHADSIDSSINSLPTELPYISLKDILQIIRTQCDRNTDSLFYAAPGPYIKLVNMLGYPLTWDLYMSYVRDELGANQLAYLERQHVNMFPLLAYQKVWFDFYRNPYRDTTIEPVAFNDDFINADNDFNVANSYIASALIKRFTPRYVRWKNDLFTASYPSAQYGNVSIAPTIGTGEIELLNASIGETQATGAEYGQVLVNGSTGALTSNMLGTQLSPETGAIKGRVVNSPFGLSILDLRRAEAMQHYKENVLRAGNKTKDNYKAHFGVEPRFIKDMHPVFLGSLSSVIDINEVTQTAGGEGETGEIFGKGISSFGNETIRYSANDFGIIIGIFSILPEVDYAATMIDPALCRLNPFDFFQPEFSKLGFEAIPRKYLYGLPLVGDENEVIGYAPRYYSYKTAIDKVGGEFMDYSLYKESTGSFVRITKSLASWVLRRDAMQVMGMGRIRDLYVDPSCVDNIFTTAASADSNTDHFLLNLWCDVKAVLPMPVLGLPTY